MHEDSIILRVVHEDNYQQIEHSHEKEQLL